MAVAGAVAGAEGTETVNGPGRGRDRDGPDYDDYRDPTAGIGGAAPARSALTLRLVLAGFGLVGCGAAAVGLLTVGRLPLLAVALGILALVAAVDVVVVVRRKARGEPG